MLQEVASCKYVPGFSFLFLTIHHAFFIYLFFHPIYIIRMRSCAYYILALLSQPIWAMTLQIQGHVTGTPCHGARHHLQLYLYLVHLHVHK